MNFFQRMAQRLRQAWAVLSDPDGGLLRHLPPPLVDPRVPEATLCAQARQQGLTDAERFLYDQWSFGVDDDEASEILDPPYVQRLRHQRETAIREYHDRQTLTTQRLADLQLRCEEAELTQIAARDRMADVAAREFQREELSLRRYLARRDIDPASIALPSPGSHAWEGETVPLAAGWRMLILVFLTGIVFAIQNFVYGFYLAGASLSENAALWFAIATAAVTVLGPHIAGLLFRSRQATGYDRWLPWLAMVVLLPALGIVGGFGYLSARLFDLGATVAGDAGGSRSGLLGITLATLIMVFTVVLLVACVMSFMLGLARRHPFQEAYVRSREMRVDAVRFRQRLGTQINPDYRAVSILDTPEDDENPGALPIVVDLDLDRELAITHAYFAAEEAYYEGLLEGVADPTFSEAIIRRRGRRAPEPPVRVPADAAPANVEPVAAELQP